MQLAEYQVVELRRYVVRDGEGERFGKYFESYFPEAFQQLGAMVFGQFLERADRSRFTFVRGFRDMEARLAVCTAMYDGPLWLEHRTKINDILLAWDDVLLLRPLRGVTLLPAVDVVAEVEDARGIVVAHIFPVAPDRVQVLAERAEEEFAGYRAAGAREAGVLVTLDRPNNFPRHPVRQDGHYLVWLGVLENETALTTRFAPAARSATAALHRSGLLRGRPELVTMDPAPRSRLRWLAGAGGEGR